MWGTFLKAQIVRLFFESKKVYLLNEGTQKSLHYWRLLVRLSCVIARRTIPYVGAGVKLLISEAILLKDKFILWLYLMED